MLERTSSCLEPASQLLLRRLETPLRSTRALGPNFWKNGADDLHLPPWCSTSLNSTRPNPQPSSSAFRVPPVDSPGLNLRSSTRQLTETRLSRSYTQCFNLRHSHSSAPGQLSQDELLEEEEERSIEGPLPSNVGPVEAPTKQQSAFAAAASAIGAEGSDIEQPLDKAPPLHSQTSAASPYMLDAAQTLEANLDYYSHNDRKPGESIFEAVRSSFIRVSRQSDYAARVLRLLSRSTRAGDLASAINAFYLIPQDQATTNDYYNAVNAAIKSNWQRVAQDLNAEARSRSLNRDCSPLLVCYALSNKLWILAAQVYQLCYFTDFQQPLHPRGYKENMATLRAEGAKLPDLPTIIIQLGNFLRSKSPMSMRVHESLTNLGYVLQHILVEDVRLMNSVSPNGLVEVLDLLSPPPAIHRQALHTLLKTRRSDRSAVGMIIYRHLRLFHSDYLLPPSAMGCLISVHCKEGAPAEDLIRLLDEFTKLHQLADKESYQRILSALSEQGDIVNVQRVFMEYCRVHGKPSEPAFFAPLLYAFARVADVKRAEDFFHLIEVWGVEQNIYCWNILLYAYVRAGKFDRAMRHFEDMITRGVVPDAHTFGTLMSIHSQSGDTENVLAIIELAQQHGIQGSYEMAAGLVHSYCFNDEVETATKFARASTESQLEGSPVKLWNHILKYYAFHAQPNKVLEIQEEMLRLGVVADDMTYAALLTTLVVVSKTPEAAALLRSLDLNQNLTATRFHYAIVLHGYLLENNRDMVQVIYTEMLDRFASIGSSARFSKLRLEGQRALETGSFDEAADYLGDILEDLSPRDRATKEPQPGFRREKGINAVPAQFLEYLVNILILKGRFKQADNLVKRFSSLIRSSYLSLSQTYQPPIQLLKARMALLQSQQKWPEVEETWHQVLEIGISLGQSYDPPNNHGDEPSSNELEVGVASSRRTEAGEAGNDVQVNSPIGREQLASKDPLDKLTKNILPARRFLLAGAMSQYFAALHDQQLHEKIIETVQKLESVGFALTSKNLNFCIQLLAQSSLVKHQILAFNLYEQRLLASSPPWKVLVRGKWIPPISASTEESAPASGTVTRRTLEKRHPGLLMPTYWTVVRLAHVLVSFQRLAERGHGEVSPLLSVARSAPGTFNFIRRLPYLPDRIQGILLRNANWIRGDPLKKLRPLETADRSGVLQSRSPIDQIPVDRATDLERDIAQLYNELQQALTPDASASPGAPGVDVDEQDDFLGISGELSGDTVDENDFDPPIDYTDSMPERDDTRSRQLDRIFSFAAPYEGQIDRSTLYLDAENRFEYESERRDRIAAQEARLLDSVFQMHWEIKLPRMMSNERFGRRAVSPISHGVPQSGRPLKAKQLYNPSNRRLERVAAKSKRQQSQQFEELSDPVSSTFSGAIRQIRAVVQDLAGEQGVVERSNAKRGPYEETSLRKASHPGTPLNVKLREKTELRPLPHSLARNFDWDRAKKRRSKYHKRLQRLKQEEIALKGDEEWEAKLTKLQLPEDSPFEDMVAVNRARVEAERKEKITKAAEEAEARAKGKTKPKKRTPRPSETP